MKEFIDRLVNIGVKPNYLPWEKHLTRKLNSIALIGLFNMLFTIGFFIVFDFHEFIFVCSLAVVALLIVFSLNYYKNYVWAVYAFFVYGYLGFFVPINLIMGLESYVGLFYFPVVISMIMLLGKKETFKHLLVLFFIGLLSIVLITLGYKLQLVNTSFDVGELMNIRLLMIIMSIFTIMAFSASIVYESIKQEELIKKMLSEKEILLAEVFHRVKNNMNIITSLLNLKKNMSDSSEVKEALEDCRNRVFSMALVHQNIFNKNNVIDLNFKSYIQQLVNEMQISLGKEKNVKIDLDADDVRLDVSTAIPCGLILNELITNSFKYAISNNGQLHIQIQLKQNAKSILLQVKDNGPGLPPETEIKGTLGLELIKDLSEQINGTYSFKNQGGLVFSLEF